MIFGSALAAAKTRLDAIVLQVLVKRLKADMESIPAEALPEWSRPMAADLKAEIGVELSQLAAPG